MQYELGERGNSPRKYKDREGMGGSILYFPRLKDSLMFIKAVGSTWIEARNVFFFLHVFQLLIKLTLQSKMF